MPDWRAQFGGTIEHDQPLSMIMIEMAACRPCLLKGDLS